MSAECSRRVGEKVRLRPSPALTVLRDLMLGGRHSRQTIALWGVSLPTADRWLKSLVTIPGVRRVRIGKVSWFEWHAPITHEMDARGRLHPIVRVHAPEPITIDGRSHVAE